MMLEFEAREMAMKIGLTRQRLIARLAMAALAAALLATAVLCGALARPRQDRAAARLAAIGGEVDAARRRWLDREPAHYRLVVERSDVWLGLCRQELEVRGGQIVAVARDSCRSVQAPPTVGALFYTIERYVREPQCGPGGCACDGYVVPDVEYDPALGFPRHVRLWRERPAPALAERLATRLVQALPVSWKAPATRLLSKAIPALSRPCVATRFGGTSMIATVTPLP